MMSSTLAVQSRDQSSASDIHPSQLPSKIIPIDTYIQATMVLEAGYPFAAASGFRKVVKATILVKKKAGMSDEDFVQHYNHKHAQMAAPVLEKHHAITYSLVRALIFPFGHQ